MSTYQEFHSIECIGIIVMIEESKAVQEVAKTAGKAIDAGTKFGDFISTFISGSLEQGMGIFEDKLKYLRWENQQRLMIRAADFMNKAKLDGPTKVLPLKIAVPFFQGASLEDNNEIQDLWAQLLVNASNEKSGIELKRIYIDILERLTSSQAKILEILYSFPFEETKGVGILS